MDDFFVDYVNSRQKLKMDNSKYALRLNDAFKMGVEPGYIIENNIPNDTLQKASDADGLSEDELVDLSTDQGARWAKSSKHIYNKFKDAGRNTTRVGLKIMPAPKTDEEYAKWGIEFLGQFNYNIPKMAADYTRLRNMDEETALNFYLLMEMYDQLPDFTWNGTKRLFNGLATDPTTIAGLGSLGLAFVGRAGAKQATKKTIMEAVKSKIKNPYVIAAIEGGAYGSIDNALRQGVAMEAEVQDEFNVPQNLLATGVGAAAGPAMVGAVDAAPAVAKAVGDRLTQPGEMPDVGMNAGQMFINPEPVKIETDEAVKVLNLRADQMKLAPKDRVQPSGDAIFKTSPEDYTRTFPEQKETPVPRAPEGKALPLGDRARKVIDMSDAISDKLAERAKPFVGSNVQYFYNTGPIVDKAVELGYSQKQAFEALRKFALNYAATSPRTQTEENLRSASLAGVKQERGIDIGTIIGPGGEGINEKGYPMIINPGGLHRKLLDDATSSGISFNTNPKPATFAENVAGNLSGVTVDTHAIRAVLDVLNELEPGSIPLKFIGGKTAAKTKEFQALYQKDPSSFDPATMVADTLKSQKIDGQDVQTEYAVFSDIYKQVAEKLGVKPAEAQSLSWFANGNKTGLASEPKTIVELIDDRVDVTAQLTGMSKDEVFKKFFQGSIPLLSVGGLTLLETGAQIDDESI